MKATYSHDDDVSLAVRACAGLEGGRRDDGWARRITETAA